jgi:hypothetical protein
MNDQSERDRRQVHQFIRAVRERVWAWDPVGLAGPGTPDDEYDCIVSPLAGYLRQGLPADAIALRLRPYVEQHFGVGLDPVATQAFATSLVAWYDAEGKPSTYG